MSHDAAVPRRLAAHAVVRDGAGRVLLVEPTYGLTWLLPGGAVERDEPPRSACAREIREELGVDLPVGRLLLLEWVGPRPGLTEGLMLVYDGGTLTTEPRLPPAELSAHRWVAPGQVGRYVDAELDRRVTAALVALRAGTVAELEVAAPLTWGGGVPDGPARGPSCRCAACRRTRRGGAGIVRAVLGCTW